MHRFFLSPESIKTGLVSFPSETEHQIRRVLRLQDGQQVVVLDNQGKEYEVKLRADAEGKMSGEVLASRLAEGEPQSRLTLYLCLSQREKFEWMLQKCTEVGAAAFVPVISSRSLVQKASAVEKKYPRWQKIIQEAAEQSGRGRIPTLETVMPFAKALQSAVTSDVALIPWIGETAHSLKQALAAVPDGGGRIAALIGPEGGFSDEEAVSAQAAGVQPVTLGKRILRMETAAVVTAAVVMQLLGEMA
jgi:16S rRNA (uracil1498-N3)-methyltransferase